MVLRLNQDFEGTEPLDRSAHFALLIYCPLQGRIGRTLHQHRASYPPHAFACLQGRRGRKLRPHRACQPRLILLRLKSSRILARCMFTYHGDCSMKGRK